MTDRPILFSAPMVRALLSGTKTQTRRVMKPQPSEHHWSNLPGYRHQLPFHAVDGCGAARSIHSWQPANGRDRAFDLGEWVPCPYGAPGDRLWVRETWRTLARYDGTAPRDVPVGEMVQHVAEEADRIRPWGCGRPSIFMPRWASRITLKVEGVRVERLKDISEADAVAEGCTATVFPEEWHAVRTSVGGHRELLALAREPSAQVIAELGLRDVRCAPAVTMLTAKIAYQVLWESINGAGSWTANPWVWVVSFRRATT